MPGKKGKRKAEDDSGPPSKKAKADPKKVEALTKAAFEGKVAAVKKNCDASTVNQKNERGQTALYCASRNGFMPIVAYLLGADADVSITDDNKSTPLHAAAFYGHAAVVQVLLDAGASTTAKNAHKMTPLQDAEAEGHDDVVGILKGEGDSAPKKGKGAKGTAPAKKSAKTAKLAEDLCTAAFKGELAKVKKLVEANDGLVDERNSRGQTALYCAARNGFKDILEYLIEEAGAEIDLPEDTAASTPLHAAAFYGQKECVEALLDAGADPLQENFFGLTPEQEARDNENTAIANFIKKKTPKGAKTKPAKKKEKVSTGSDVVDIVFSFDTTGSMYACLEQVRTQIAATIKTLFAQVPGIRIGVIAHGDYCDAKSSYVVKFQDFTQDEEKLLKFVRGVKRTGGGDAPECYELAMRTAREMGWSEDAATRALVLLGDDVPHEPSYAMNKANIDWRKEAELLNEMEVMVYGVQCLNRSYATKFYKSISETTGGQHLTLSNFSSMTDIFVALCLKQGDEKRFADYRKEVKSAGRENPELKKAMDSIEAVAVRRRC